MKAFFRSLLAALAGYVSLSIAMMGIFTVAYLLLGAENSFKQGSWEASNLWVVMSMVVGFGVAILGGWVAKRVDPYGLGSKVLVIIIVVMGLATAILSGSSDTETVRTIVSPNNTEAMMNAIQPTWLRYANIVVGVSGVLIGARLKSSQ